MIMHRLRTSRSSRVGDETALRVALCFAEPRIMHEKRRAIWAEDLAVLTHVEINMRMVERRARSHAVELFDADKYALCACIVGKMGNESAGHGHASCRKVSAFRKRYR